MWGIVESGGQNEREREGEREREIWTMIAESHGSREGYWGEREEGSVMKRETGICNREERKRGGSDTQWQSVICTHMCTHPLFFVSLFERVSVNPSVLSLLWGEMVRGHLNQSSYLWPTVRFFFFNYTSSSPSLSFLSLSGLCLF